MSESAAPDWREEAAELNEALHHALGATPCRTACTHFLTDRWSLLGIANVAARNGIAVA